MAMSTLPFRDAPYWRRANWARSARIWAEIAERSSRLSSRRPS